MEIRFENAGKKFNREWIFRNLDFSFSSNTCYSITGNNGSGKSTLLQIIAGSIQLSEGKGVWLDEKNASIDGERIYQHISIAAPYVELIEEMSVKEMLEFHFEFKSILPGLTIDEIITIIGLDSASNKQMRFFSSGMKQRVKLAQAIFSNTPILLLDEPCTNLDKLGYQLYHELIERFCSNRLVVVSSNDENEIDFCTVQLDITKWK